MGVDAEREAEDEEVDGGSGSRLNNIPGTVRTGVSAGAGEGGEEGTRGEEEGTGGVSIANFPLCLLSFSKRARAHRTRMGLHADAPAACKMLERLDELHLRHRARRQKDRIALEVIDDRGNTDERAE